MDEQPLGKATVVAIVALWFHVALSVVLLLGFFYTAGSGRPTSAFDAAAAFLSGIWIVLYTIAAIGLQRRQPWARGLAIAVSGLAYAIGLFQGRIISTTVLILIPLLIAQRQPVAPRDVPSR